MKKLARHGRWIFTIHLPIVSVIAFCLLFDPFPILSILTSPWLWGFFCLAGLLSQPLGTQTYASPKPIFRAWLLTWVIQYALTIALNASLFFTHDLFAVSSAISSQSLFPWLYIAALVCLIATVGKRQSSFSIQTQITPWFPHSTAELCARKFTLITTQLAVNWVFLPMIFCCYYFGFEFFHHGHKLSPSINTIILLFPLLHFIKHQPWQKSLRFFLKQRVPLWLIASVVYSIVIFFMLLLQPIAEHFFIIDRLLTQDVLTSIHQSPWPAPLPSLTHVGWMLLWWIAWSWPAAAHLHALYRNQHPIFLLLGLCIGFALIHYFPILMTPTSATLSVFFATPVLFALVLKKKAYQAMICAELPLKQSVKTRNFARQLNNNLNALACFLVIIMTFGMDWITWVLLGASMPGIIMLFYAMIQRFILRKAHVRISTSSATKSKQ